MSDSAPAHANGHAAGNGRPRPDTTTDPAAPASNGHTPTAAASNLAYLEDLFERYLTDADAVDASLHPLFEQWIDERPELAARRDGTPPAGDRFALSPSFPRRSIFGGRAAITDAHRDQAIDADHRFDPGLASLQHRVDKLVRNYRVRGHLKASIDPLGQRKPELPELDPATYGFSQADMNRRFFTAVMPDGDVHTLREIIDHLERTYCGEIGVQFMHIDSLRVREWLQERMEKTENRLTLSRKEQIRILTRLTDAVIFEEFIQKKFIGAKSFSLEGAESLIPLLDMALEKAGDQGIKEVIIGMAHRGRLNVLANIVGKSPRQIFREFEDREEDARQFMMGGGDVKYHLGYSGDWRTRHGQNIHLSLCFNPSHLEFVNPVALGRLRAKQDRVHGNRAGASRGEGGTSILIHGDAAFAGEGIVQETLNLSELSGYRIGGTLHIVVNNQIGFTTFDHEGRSTTYATDVAKMLQVPIFHVNGESPEAVAQVIDLAMEFRYAFKRDVVIDMLCYRKRGHNESDEPSYTQPLMYKKIRSRAGVREAYLEHLTKLGGVSHDDAERIASRRAEILERELSEARNEDFERKTGKHRGLWSQYKGGRDADTPDVDTGVQRDQLVHLLDRLTTLPETFHLHPKLRKAMDQRREMRDAKRALDWASAEALAFATLLVEGQRVRLSGQDCRRGTFSQRHAVLFDYENGDLYTPLAHLTDKYEDQGNVDIYNSPLSEAGVLGFDYGYSLDWPDGLTAWEAQFGDFVNAAQVIIDQFIISAEDKWNRLSGITLLLPHGYEGMGPEHSSARIERFLNLAAEDNIQVCYPSTPAQYYHLLRRQVLRPLRKPLVVFTPKSLLRHPRCTSDLDDLTTGTYRRVILDHPGHNGRPNRSACKKMIMCAGKVYYDLIERREQLQRPDIPILRLEQFYPFPTEQMKEALAPYKKLTDLVWVQEEPANQGAWPFLKSKAFKDSREQRRFHAICRRPSASPATGSKAAHNMEQQRILEQAFAE